MAADMTDAVMVMNATEIQSLVNDAILRALDEWAARQAGAIRAAVLQALDERALDEWAAREAAGTQSASGPPDAGPPVACQGADGPLAARLDAAAATSPLRGDLLHRVAAEGAASAAANASAEPPATSQHQWSDWAAREAPTKAAREAPMKSAGSTGRELRPPS